MSGLNRSSRTTCADIMPEWMFSFTPYVVMKVMDSGF